jgi:putative FmdB family regulatory protein
MPIYAYRCAACGHAKDVLRKISDAPLTDCPACGAPRFEKQVTAAGFQLKGSGWYVTDFREGSGKKADKPADANNDGKSDGKSDGKADAKPGADGAAAAPAAAPAPTTAAPAPSPAAAAPPPTSSSS